MNLDEDHEDKFRSRSIIRNTLWKLLERVASQSVTLIVSFILARVLDVSDFGLIAIVTIFVSISNIFVTSGLGTSLIQKKNADIVDFSSVLYVNIIMSIVLYFSLFISAPYIAKMFDYDCLRELLRVQGLAIIIASYKSIQLAYISKNMMFKIHFHSTIYAKIISGITGISLALTNFGVWALVYQSLVLVVLETVISAYIVRWHPQLVFSMKKAKPLLIYGWRVLIVNFLITANLEFRSFLVGIYSTTKELAYFKNGETYPRFISSNINAVIATIILPVFSHYQHDAIRIYSLIRKSMQLVSFLLLPTMLGLFMVSREFILVFLSEKWIFMNPFFKISCISMILNVYNDMLYNLMKAIGRSGLLLGIQLVMFVLSILMVVVAIRISVIAVALGGFLLAFVELIITLTMLSKYNSYNYLSFFKDVLPPFFMTIVMVGCILLISMIKIPLVYMLITKILIGASVYLLLSWITNNTSFQFIRNIFISHINKK